MDQMTEENMVVSLGRAARHISSTIGKIKALIKSGDLVGVRLPGRVRFSGVTMDSLKKLVAKSAVAGGAE